MVVACAPGSPRRFYFGGRVAEKETGAPAEDNIARGILLTIISVMIFGVQDALAKILVQDWSPFQIAMMRYWAFGLFSLYLVSRQAPLWQAFASKALGWQIARGFLLMADVWLFAFAVKTVPLPELHAILMLYPLLVTLIAIPVLGEKVGPFRIGAVVVGFAGALLMVRPGGLPISWGVIFGILAAFAYSSYIVATRITAKADSTATNMVFVGVIGMVCSTAVGIFFWEPMGPRGLILVALVMVTTITAHALMMKALSYAPASVVQPFNYLMLPWAILLSLVIFSHLIDFVSFLGALIIVGAGLIVWWRERKRKVRVSAAETTPAEKA